MTQVFFGHGWASYAKRLEVASALTFRTLFHTSTAILEEHSAERRGGAMDSYIM